MTEESVGDLYAHRLAIMLECALLNPTATWNDAHSLLDEYRQAVLAEHRIFNEEPVAAALAQGMRDTRASIVAAAPDLLAALQELLNQFEQRGIQVDPEHPNRIAAESARAAIAKATGESA